MFGGRLVSPCICPIPVHSNCISTSEIWCETCGEEYTVDTVFWFRKCFSKRGFQKRVVFLIVQCFLVLVLFVGWDVHVLENNPQIFDILECTAQLGNEMSCSAYVYGTLFYLTGIFTYLFHYPIVDMHVGAFIFTVIVGFHAIGTAAIRFIFPGIILHGPSFVTGAWGVATIIIMMILVFFLMFMIAAVFSMLRDIFFYEERILVNRSTDMKKKEN